MDSPSTTILLLAAIGEQDPRAPLAVYVPERDVYVDHADKDNGIVVCCSSSSSRMKVVQSVSDNIIIARWAIHYNMTLT